MVHLLFFFVVSLEGMLVLVAEWPLIITFKDVPFLGTGIIESSQDYLLYLPEAHLSKRETPEWMRRFFLVLDVERIKPMVDTKEKVLN